MNVKQITEDVLKIAPIYRARLDASATQALITTYRQIHAMVIEY